MIAAELLHEFFPSDGGSIFGSGAVILPPGQGSPGELVGCQENLVSILAFERLELPLDHTQPVVCIQGVARSGKGGRLGPQKNCQLVVHGLLSWPLVDEGIGQCFQYEGPIVDPKEAFLIDVRPNSHLFCRLVILTLTHTFLILALGPHQSHT